MSEKATQYPLAGRSRFRAILGVTVLLVSFTGACDRKGAVPVPNGGFENATIEPWTPFQAVRADLDSNQVHSGKGGLAQTLATGSVYQDVQGLIPGVGYIVSAWVSGSPDATATAQIAVFDAGVPGATMSHAIKPTTRWQLLQYEFKVSAASRGIARIHLFRNEGRGTVRWDDVQVARTE